MYSLYVCIYVCNTFMCLCNHLYIYISCVHMYIGIYVHVGMYICIYVSMYICI